MCEREGEGEERKGGREKRKISLTGCWKSDVKYPLVYAEVSLNAKPQLLVFLGRKKDNSQVHFFSVSITDC